MTAERRDGQGQLGIVWLVFWLPDYRPESHIAELRSARPPGTARIFSSFTCQIVSESVFTVKKREPGQIGSLIRSLREANERVLPEEVLFWSITAIDRASVSIS